MKVSAVYVRKVAIRLRHEGVDPDLVATALGVSKLTVASWLAHEKTGTYRKNGHDCDLRTIDVA